MFKAFKKWFQKKSMKDQGWNGKAYRPALVMTGAASRAVSEEVIGRVVTGIELEGLGTLGSANPEKKTKG